MDLSNTSHIHLHVRECVIKSDQITNQDRCLFVCFARPQKANSLSRDMLEQASAIFEQINIDDQVKVVVLYGEGRNFCSGVDLGWFRELVELSEIQRSKQIGVLEKFFFSLANIKVPVIGCVHGICAGGGVGMLAVCDSVIAHLDTKFTLAEVKLGLIPAIIMPYLTKKISSAYLKRWAMTGREISVKEALASGLCHDTFDHHPIKSIKKEIISYLQADVSAQKLIKTQLNYFSSLENDHHYKNTIKYNGNELLTKNLSKQVVKQGLDGFLFKHSEKHNVDLVIPSSIKLPCPPFNP